MINDGFNKAANRARREKRFEKKFERAKGWILSTDVGQALWTSFEESGGRFGLAPDMDSPRGRYDFKINWIILGKHFTPSDIVHELAHARQYRKALEFMERSMNILDEQHRVMAIEADAWAISSIFLKQFFRRNMDKVDVLDEFMAAEKQMLIHSRIVAPNKLEGSKRLWSTLELDLTATRNYAAGAGKKIYADDITEDLILEIEDGDLDASWASEIFRRSFVEVPASLSKERSNAQRYTSRLFNARLETTKTFGKMVEGLKIPKLTEKEYRDAFIKLGDLEDIGLDQNYFSEGGLDWCLKTPKIVLNNFRMLAEAVQQDPRYSQKTPSLES